ncbi:MAG: acyl-CoA dehydrogenase family protein [Deltaproteobacteria bacterium]|nr:acyl-CoA dehydrogenase family protein [Deltaproteobacteria bacterium]MDD9852442.1 acyl-CoA dehydrogenase family protein [Deltaproteobacteria bacterium]
MLLDEELSDEERVARDAVRSFVTSEFLPLVQEHIRRDGSFPMELVPRLAELGVFGANMQGYGCAGLGEVAYGLVMQELERGDSGLRSFASVQSALCMFPIHAYGSEAQKERWLPGMAKGELIGCFGLTEPDFGSYAQGMRTRGERSGGGWRLNGTKRWITNGSIADLSVIWARCEEGVQGFVVEKGAPGFEARDIKGKFSLRGSVTSELFLQDVEVSEENRLPGALGMKGPLSCLTQARYGIAWGALGAALACFDEVVEYARSREVQGGPLAGKQLTQARLADMLTEITKAQLLALRLGRLKEQGRLHHAMVSMAKRNNVDIALQVARAARDLLGANGIVDDYQAMRHMVNLETVRTYEGTHDIHTLVLGEHITGMRAL